MYITNVIGEKTIDLSYQIWNLDSIKVVGVKRMLSDNVQYEVVKDHTIIDSVSPDKLKTI